MFGFSVYLSAALDQASHEYVNRMVDAGFTGVFTSLHIPEDDPQVLRARLELLADWCRARRLTLTADVSGTGLHRLGWSLGEPERILATGLTALRIDDGVDLADVARLSRAMPVALNASTITASDVDALRRHDARFSQLNAWHNYYPRTETGLERGWYLRKNQWLHDLGLHTVGFIPGDGALRGPLHLHLPTLEAHREWSPLAAYLDLRQAQTDDVYVADNTVSASSLRSLTRYLHDQVVTLRIDGLLSTSGVDPGADLGTDSGADPNASLISTLGSVVWHNRPDVARDVVRLRESRGAQLLPVAANPHLVQPRLLGTVTVDNAQYGRYAGELQITRRDLPADSRVNVLGRVIPADRPLLNHIEANTGIQFAERN